MTALIFVVFMSIMITASPGWTGISPEGAFEAGLLDDEPPPCREPTAGERLQRGLDPKGKASTFSLNGEYLCEHDIFDPGERDGYMDFVVREAGGNAQRVARHVASLMASEKKLAGRVWSVEVRGGPVTLQPHLRRVYLQALSEALGTMAVARNPKAIPDIGMIIVSPRAVQDADILFDVTATIGIDEDRKTWRL